MIRAHRSPLALLVLLSPALAARGDVLVVDGGGGGDHTTISAAVAAAAPGTTILVRSGAYPGFTIDSKSVDVFADHGATVLCTSTVTVRNLVSIERVVLSGIDVENVAGVLQLVIENCDGNVFVQDGSYGSTGTIFAPDLTDAVGVVDSSAVVFESCSLVGGEAFDISGNIAGAGLVATDSNVKLLRSTLRGVDGFGSMGGGGGQLPMAATPGGHGADVTGGSIYLEGCDVDGGEGGDGFTSFFGFPCTDGGDGGHGVRLDGGAHLQRKDSTIDAGTGGIGGLAGSIGGPNCADGVDGSDVALISGTTGSFDVGARGFDVTVNPVREGQMTSAVFTGVPGDIALLLFGVTPECELEFFFQGIDLQSTLILLVAGSLDAGGSLVSPFTVGDFNDPLLQSVNVYEQALFFNLTEMWVTGPAKVVCHLDQMF